MPRLQHRTLLRPARALALLALAASSASAQTTPLQTGHAVRGWYGLEAVSRPSLGMSYANRTMLYSASTERDRDGNDTGADGSISQFANYTTASWMSPWLIFGGNYVASVTLPLLDSGQNPRGLDYGSDGFGLGDLQLQPLQLYWPLERATIQFGYSLWLPTGKFDSADTDNKGKGFLSHEFNFGWTHRPFVDESWHYSIVSRMSFHGSVDGLDATPGDDLLLDWSAGKRLGERWNVGLLGYGVFQTSRDRGADANEAIGFYGLGAAGIGARYELPDWGGHAGLRLYQEFQAFNQPEGQLAVLELAFRL
jgi:hypothetical protein